MSDEHGQVAPGSPHFSPIEFRDKRTGQLKGPDPRLLEVLERIRALRPGPLRIISGYRSPETNKAVGGAPRSQHLYGRAADIPPGRATPAEAIRCGATGVGIKGQWAVHVDVRGGPCTTWTY